MLVVFFTGAEGIKPFERALPGREKLPSSWLGAKPFTFTSQAPPRCEVEIKQSLVVLAIRHVLGFLLFIREDMPLRF